MKKEPKGRVAAGTLCVLLVAGILTAQQRSRLDVPEEIVRQLIASGVRPESLRLRSDGTPDGLSATSVNLDKNGARGLVVVGTSLGELCGATGNCAHWLFARAANQYRLLLDANSIQHLEVLRTSRQGRRDILTTRHDSAFDYTLFRYQFNGQRYDLVECREKHYDSVGSGRARKAPVVTRVSCP